MVICSNSWTLVLETVPQTGVNHAFWSGPFAALDYCMFSAVLSIYSRRMLCVGVVPKNGVAQWCFIVLDNSGAL